ncbi:CURVATURE THYLAKOID 1B, chloroplastic-like protein [Drosera capensis]
MILSLDETGVVVYQDLHEFNPEQGRKNQTPMAMAATTSASLSLSSSSALLDTKKPLSAAAAAAASLPALPRPPPLHTLSRLFKPSTFCKRVARNVATMATSEAQVVVRAEVSEDIETSTTETPEILKKVIDAWDKVEDKYAVTSLAVAGGIALWGSTGLIAAIDRLPLAPGIFELVGIGFTGGGFDSESERVVQRDTRQQLNALQTAAVQGCSVANPLLRDHPNICSVLLIFI